jgi:hypothetical protein
MPLNMPNLDDRTYADLVQEALSMLPHYAPEWTNHNPSDPGITLIELLAYFTEMLIYRLNRVTRENKLKFLWLLCEDTPEAIQEMAYLLTASVAEVDEALKRAVLNLRQPQRAVTSEDYESLVKTVTTGNAEQPRVVRTHCFERCNLDLPDDQSRALDRPGHVSVLIVPDRELEPEALTSLLRVIRDALEPMRLLTTRLHVVRPYYLWLSVGATIQTYPDISFAEVRSHAIEKLQQYFNPLPGGGPDGQGWPFGRAVYLSEVYDLLEQIEGVDYVQNVYVSRLTTTSGTVNNARTAVGLQIGVRSTVGVDSRLGCETPADTERLSRDAAGRLMGVLLQPYELARMAVQESDLLDADTAARARSMPPVEGGL